MIRRLNISTTFLVPIKLSMELFPRQKSLPPENYEAWEQACSTISSLHNLQILIIDMAVWNYHNYSTSNTIEDDHLISILSPLRGINAKHLKVEINAELSTSVRKILEPLGSSIIRRHRPYNSKVFRQG
jgi:hypothetical protein